VNKEIIGKMKCAPVNATVVNGALSALTDTISMGGIANQDASDGARATVLRNGTFTGFTRHTCSQ
jgi:hypothetical protein